MRRRLLILALALAVIVGSWFGFQGYQSRRLRSELKLAEREFANHQVSAARARLARLTNAARTRRSRVLARRVRTERGQR